MYQFAIVALLALAVVKVVDFIDGAIPALSGFRSLFTFVFGIASVWALDYSLFDGFGIATPNRNDGPHRRRADRPLAGAVRVHDPRPRRRRRDPGRVVAHAGRLTSPG